MSGPEPQGLGDVLDRLFARKGEVSRQRRRLAELRAAWVAVAGEEIAGHTRVRSCLRGVLCVEVDSAARCHRLAGFERDRLLVALKERVRSVNVTDLRFRIGAVG